LQNACEAELIITFRSTRMLCIPPSASNGLSWKFVITLL